MATPKTRPTTVPVETFIDALEGDQIRDDCRLLTIIRAGLGPMGGAVRLRLDPTRIALPLNRRDRARRS